MTGDWDSLVWHTSDRNCTDISRWVGMTDPVLSRIQHSSAKRSATHEVRGVVDV